MDWASRRVLAWRLSNTMDTSLCLEALDDALDRGVPEILNTDQVPLPLLSPRSACRRVCFFSAVLHV